MFNYLFSINKQRNLFVPQSEYAKVIAHISGRLHCHHILRS